MINDTLGLEPMIDLLNEFNLTRTPPVFIKEKDSSDFLKKAVLIKKYTYQDIFFLIDIFPDVRNPSKNMLLMGCPTSTGHVYGL